MLKKASSFVLASLRGSTYLTEYAFASSLAAAALEDFLNILRYGPVSSWLPDRLMLDLRKDFFRQPAKAEH
jgi:hypothetical protein